MVEGLSVKTSDSRICCWLGGGRVRDLKTAGHQVFYASGVELV